MNSDRSEDEEEEKALETPFADAGECTYVRCILDPLCPFIDDCLEG